MIEDDDDIKNSQNKTSPVEEEMYVDSGVTSHFVRPNANWPQGKNTTKQVKLPDRRTLKSTQTTELPFPKLTTGARKAYILPGLRKYSLLSVPKLADEGYTTVFHAGKEGMEVYEANSLKIQAAKPPIQGCRNQVGDIGP